MRYQAALTLAALFVLSTTVTFAIEHTTDSLTTVKKNVADDKAMIVDVREQDEWEDGHLQDALFIPLSDLKDARSDKFGTKLPKDKIIYCHCAVGVRAITAGNILKDWGYDVRPLKAGYDELLEAGFPAAK